MAKFDPAEASFIDEGIRSLVVALNTWPAIKTLGSCEGHKESSAKWRSKRPYVQFHGPYKLVEGLRKKIKGTNWTITNGGKNIWFVMRPYKRQKSYLHVEEVSELVKMPNCDLKDIEQRIITFIHEYICNPKTGKLRRRV